MIWIVLPAYNEEAAIEPLFARLADAASQMAVPFELILADDGSTDGTVEKAHSVAGKLGLKVHIVQHRHNRGLGDTLKMGLTAFIQMAGPSDFACTMDCDNTQPPELIESMIDLARADQLDIVVASRYQPGAAVKGLSQFRQTLSQGASSLFRIFTPVPGLKDYTCGYRLYSFEFLQRLFGFYEDRLFTESGFACMADLLLKSRALRPRIGEVAMVLRYDEKLGASKMKVARTIYQTLRLLAKHSFGPRPQVSPHRALGSNGLAENRRPALTAPDRSE
jgi:dolichol-phosphate mannosyltransferase